MKLLLDTHVFTWAILSPERLSKTAQSAILSDDNDVFVSLGSVWEIAIKVGLGRWREAALLLANIETELNIAGFELKPIELAHVRLAGLSQSSHRDPFDRLLAAQATLDGLSLVSADRIITTLTPNVLW